MSRTKRSFLVTVAVDAEWSGQLTEADIVHDIRADGLHSSFSSGVFGPDRHEGSRRIAVGDIVSVAVAPKNQMSDIEGLHGRLVRRKPSGRWCVVTDTDSVSRKIQIRDGRWCGWVAEKTFIRKWECLPK
jgi:hypothetical protein